MPRHHPCDFSLAVLTSLPDANHVVRSIPPAKAAWDATASREWLVTNGLGGYASGTIAGPPTRRYHSLLVAALPAPVGRVALLASIDASVARDNEEDVWLNHLGEEGPTPIVEFRLVAGVPIWTYEVAGATLERRLFMPHEQNTVVVTYSAVRVDLPIRLRLRPQIQARLHEAPVDAEFPTPPALVAYPGYLEITVDPSIAAMRVTLSQRTATFRPDPASVDVHYALEEERGYAARGHAWSPGYYEVVLSEGEHVTVLASTNDMADIEALSPDAAWQAELERRTRLLVTAGTFQNGGASSDPPGASESLAAELVLAADQFIIQPAARTADEARLRASGEHACSVIAGYHWFTDWGRDTMISLEGLTLTTGRIAEARGILLTFAHHLRDGLLPNLFPEGSREGLYHTADATMWLFHAIDRYVTITGDVDTLRVLLPRLEDVVNHHVQGTRFGIRMDEDGLLTQGDAAFPLTWMDARVEGWIVTPRRGKAVEINALWFNALSLLASWRRQFDQNADELELTAMRVMRSFNNRFWFDRGGYLYDIVDGERGDDAACRPNQIFSLALRFPVLDPSRWAAVTDTVAARLLTRFGLRTLAQDDPMFKAQYFGDLRARDAAYHQGTVWAWLIGPFIDAWLRVYPDRVQEARTLVEGFAEHLSEACVGTISEIFDGTTPFSPRGCVAQAWSVAEVLRCLARLQVGAPAPAAVAHVHS